MVSGPYQSKLLRLVIRLCRDGLERHRRAVRQTQMNITMGTVIGSAWILAPLRKVSQKLSYRLTQYKRGRAANLRAAKSAKYTDEPIADILTSVKRDLLSDQFVKRVNSPEESRIFFLPRRTFSVLERSICWVHRLTGRSQQQVPKTTAEVIGIASNLRNRNLVLVLDDATVWDGLSLVQQCALNRKIAGCLSSVRCELRPSSEVALGGQFALTLAKAGLLNGVRSPLNINLNTRGRGLMRSIRSFWVDVLGIVANLRRQQRQLPWGRMQLDISIPSEEKLFRTQQISLLVGSHALQNSVLGAVSYELGMHVQDARSIDIEANVTSVIYVEHPLERLLNGLDRILLWLERQSARVSGWLRRAVGFSS